MDFCNNILKTIRLKFRQFSIKTRLYFIFLLQMIIFICWCNYTIYISFNEYKTYINNSNDRIIYNITKTLNTYINNLEQISKSPILRSENGNPTYIYKYLSNAEYDNIDKYQYFHEVQSSCQRLLYLHPFLKTITIYNLDENGVSINRDGIYTLVKNNSNTNWFNDTLQEKGRKKIWNYEDIKNINISNTPNIISASRAIVNVEMLKNIGVILISADIENLNRFFKSNRVFQEQNIGVYTLEGKCLMGNMDSNIFKTLYNNIKSKGFDPNNFSQINGLSKLTVNGREKIYNYSTFCNNYICIIETPNPLIITNSIKMQKSVFIMLGTLLLTTIILVNTVIKSITRPLSNLVESCENIKAGNFSVNIPVESNDEISQFTKSFNAMASEIDTLIQKIYREQSMKCQIEIQMLMNQINPHFLYNTLENIRSTAYVKGEYDLSEMASLLGKILRSGISNSHKIVTVKKELEILEDYINLIKLRYRNKISFNIHIDKTILNYKIIKLVLQPVVENAIYHGISTISSNGIINILGYADGDNIVFQIIDNGIGIDKKTLENLNGYINGENEFFNSVGLKNVNLRIKLYYNKKYGIKIESALGKGTMVKVNLPIINETSLGI